MKYKYCPDCGSKLTHSKSRDGWAEFYDCDMGCHLRIEIEHGETMHAAPDREKWTRVEPRKPREWRVPLKGGEVCHNSVADEIVHVREVIE